MCFFGGSSVAVAQFQIRRRLMILIVVGLWTGKRKGSIVPSNTNQATSAPASNYRLSSGRRDGLWHSCSFQFTSTPNAHRSFLEQTMIMMLPGKDRCDRLPCPSLFPRLGIVALAYFGKKLSIWRRCDCLRCTFRSKRSESHLPGCNMSSVNHSAGAKPVITVDRLLSSLGSSMRSSLVVPNDLCESQEVESIAGR